MKLFIALHNPGFDCIYAITHELVVIFFSFGIQKMSNESRSAMLAKDEFAATSNPRRGQRRRHHHRPTIRFIKNSLRIVSRHRAVCVDCSSSPGARVTAKRVLRLGQPRRPL